MTDPRPTAAPDAVPVFRESPAAPLIIVPGAPDEIDDDPIASADGCLEQAMQWLDAARMHTVEMGAPVTSLHVAGGARR